MKEALFTVVTFLCLSFPAFAQDTLWSRTYSAGFYDIIDWDDGVSVQQTTDGGYIVTGHADLFGSAGVYLIKTNSTGEILWTRTYGGTSADAGLSVQQTTDGGYIVAGVTHAFGAGSGDVYLIKTNSNGDILWSRTYGGSEYDGGYSVQQTADGGYIVVGWTGSFGAGEMDVYLIKTDASGDPLWSRTYGGNEWDNGFSVQQTTDGGYIVAGHTFSFDAGAPNVYLIKTDASGDTLWTHTYVDSPYAGYGYSVQQTTDGGYIVAGQAFFWTTVEGVYLLKTNFNGDILWSHTYGYGSREAGYCVQQTTDGGYIVAGYTSTGGAWGHVIYVIKTNSNGDTLWNRTLSWVLGFYQGYSVQQTADGGYIVAGLILTDYNKDVILFKLDRCGNTCAGQFISPPVLNVSPTVTSLATVIMSPSTIVTSPPTPVTSPPTEIFTNCVATGIRGDANGDGVINSADVVYLINYLFVPGSPAPDPLWVGDANCDRVIDSADVVYLINYLFVPGSPPPSCWF